MKKKIVVVLSALVLLLTAFDFHVEQGFVDYTVARTGKSAQQVVVEKQAFDTEWGYQFERTYGRPPTNDDWKADPQGRWEGYWASINVMSPFWRPPKETKVYPCENPDWVCNPFGPPGTW